MQKHLKRFIGYLLTITLIFSDLSIGAYAEETAEAVENVTSKAESVDDATENILTKEEPEIISELTDKRDEQTKYFAMSDGTVKVCIYPQNVHYLEDGKYKEIDNTLVETVEDDKVFYKNKKNGFSVKMPESFSDDYIEFSDENGYVKFRLQGATNKKIEKIEKKQKKNSKDKTTVNNVNDKAIFKSIKSDVDIEYDLAGNKLKETIILYKKTKNSFVFDVQTSAIKAEINTDNSISFFDEKGVELYMIASPYMTDEAGAYSNAIETNLLKSETGYTLTYTPEYEWLSAKEREYPVRIDPTLFQAIYKETVTDTYISNVQTTSDPDIRGYWDVLNIGRRATTLSSGTQLTKRGLIRFEIPSEIGKNDCIIEAKLDLVHYTVPAAVSVDDIQIDVHELTSGFTEGGTWWGNQPTFDPIITDYALVDTSNTFSGSTLSYDSYNITKLVNKWHNGGNNYGIMLKLHDEDATVSSSKQVYYFAKQSTYYGSVSKFVEITYRNATGLEDYWSYTTQDFGQYGTGHVNNYNGNLVYVHEDASFHSLINGFTLSHVYNTNLSSTGTGYYGSGWRLNLVQKLEPITVTGNSSVKYVYTDGDGTRHYFVENTDGTIVDEDGLGYTYETISEGTLTKKLTDKNGNIFKFDNLNYLRKIIDSNGNTINLNYSSRQNGVTYLSSITTSSGGNIALGYDSNSYLTSITDNAGRVTSYAYTSGNLTEITYPDGTALKFTYDTNNHWIKAITSPDGMKLTYSNYLPSGKISKSQSFGTDGTASASSSFQYSQNQTRIVDSYNRGITYQFDTWGRPTCVYDDNQNIYSQTYNATVTSGTGIFNNNKLESTSNGTVYVNNLLSNAVFDDGLTNWEVYKEIEGKQYVVIEGPSLISDKPIQIVSNEIGSVKIKQTLSITKAQTYTFSGYISSQRVESENQGAGLEVVVTGNTTKYYYSDFIIGATDTEVDNGFQRVSVTFTLEDGETITQVSAGLYNAYGAILVDSLQLEEGDTANPINMVENSSFEESLDTNGTPTGYSYYTNVKNGAVTTEKKLGKNSYAVNGVAKRGTRRIHQYLYISGKAGDGFSFGSWAKANSVPKKDNTDFGIYLRIEYNDNTGEIFIIDFNQFVSDWQFASKTAIAKKDYRLLEICFQYNNNINTAYLDNLFVYRDTMQSYIYDNNGNVISTSDYASQNSTFQYNNNNLAKFINPTGSSYEYLYDEKNNMISARSGEGLIYDAEYDEHGNVLSTSIGTHNYSSSIQDGKTYYIRLKNSGKYLAVEGSGTSDGTNVIQESYTGADNQKWTVELMTDGYYCLHPVYLSDMSIGVTDGASSTNGDIAIHINDLSDAQKYRITPQSNYTYQIKPKCYSDKVVTVPNSTTQNNVVASEKRGTSHVEQDWYFVDVAQTTVTAIADGGVYQFRVLCTGKYMDLSNETLDIGTEMQQYKSTMSDTQRYILNKYEDTAYYTIASFENRERLLEISTELNSNGNIYLQVGDNVVNDNKLFKLEYNSENKGFYIIPKTNETLALDVADNSMDSGARLVFTKKTSNTCQIFIAEKFSDTISSSATYQDNGNYLHTTTDERGNTTVYTYDTNRGLQTSVTDAKGNTTSYIYNTLNDRLKSVNFGNSTVSYSYKTNGNLNNITTASGTRYTFQYDSLGRVVATYIGTNSLSQITYRDNYSSLISKIVYSNGNYKDYTYDNQDRLVSESLNGTKVRTYVYDKSGNVAKINDFITGDTTTFRYDLIGRTVAINTSNNQSVNYIYDDYNRLLLSKWTIGDIELSNGYIYKDNSKQISRVSLNDETKLIYQYDNLRRSLTRTLKTSYPFVTRYEYLKDETNSTTTTLVKRVVNMNDVYEYTYDELGYITSITKNGTLVETYSYDSLGQLISATHYGDTYTYSYDNGGNIRQIKKNDVVIKSYAYDNDVWKDLLTAFNGESITYDGIGNPLNYREGMNFTWQNGRQLKSITRDGSALASYTYDADGLRTVKTVNGVTTEYFWQNGMLYGQKTGNEYMFFLYDEDGRAYGFIIQKGTSQSYYYYEFNLQGDIIGIIQSNGTKIVNYIYDAWGNIVTIQGNLYIGEKNPLRYRGYYYDRETGFYYLQSRYYDPEIGRFINADGVIASVDGSIQGYNMFAYCFNNPVNMSDSSGHWPSLIKKIVNGILNVIENALTVKYDVPLYNQGQTSLCWAYCQVMVEDYQNKTVRTQEKANERAKELAIEKNGKYNWNKGNWPTNCKEYDIFGSPKAVTEISSRVDLYMQIIKEGPLYAYYSDSDSAHLIVVTGINLFRGIVYTNNPWGIAGTQTYAQFLNGFAGGKSDGSYPLKFYIFIN